VTTGKRCRRYKARFGFLVGVHLTRETSQVTANLESDMATKHTRALVDRLLAAVEDRVNLNTRREVETSGDVAKKKVRARLNESSEILGILRNVVKAWEAEQS
jgi:hypothetical protein